MATYKYAKVKNGIGNYALIDLIVEKNSLGENQIFENYSGKGFSSQGYTVEVPKFGYSRWKRAVLSGLKYAIEKTDESWTIQIDKLEGLPATDTNSTVVFLTTILAFYQQIQYTIKTSDLLMIEDLVVKSWKNKDIDLVPNIKEFSFYDSEEFVSCDIYRDGGSYEGIWKRNNQNLYITLKVSNMPNGDQEDFENRPFTLHSNKLINCNSSNVINKSTIEYLEINHFLSEWDKVEQNENNGRHRLNELIEQFKKGNY